eukprot:CAMPEP_0167758098 /NCGR_PEP_ID=MMETSP0110_2-20121227/10283_1 /TAXON_ID=629695 /ORGANISM="Gymnochlora sp., Strain CCMP2014" /LENGTH=232 /DNA_ID=CAMNT_0007644343 /DNA_START=65 /DNA_END=760 /DNA_ORIENTATION=+
MAKQTTKTRIIPNKVIEKWLVKVERVEEDVRAVLQMEYEEKMLRIAEMENNKSTNMIVHEDEISRRPARTWFQSEKDKKRIKEKTRAAALGLQDPDEKEALEEKKEMKTSDKKKKKKDSLKGLSRSKRRRKMFLQRELEAASEAPQKKTPQVRQAEAARKAKAARRVRKQDIDADVPEKKNDRKVDNGHGDHEQVTKKKKRKRYMTIDEDQADSFARRYADVKEKVDDDSSK